MVRCDPAVHAGLHESSQPVTPRMLLAGVQEVLEKPGFPLKDCGNDDKMFRRTFMVRRNPPWVMAGGRKHTKSLLKGFS
jgi:hypothetical protein